MTNGDDEKRQGILNQKSERRVNCLSVSDGPLFVTVKKEVVLAAFYNNGAADEIII